MPGLFGHQAERGHARLGVGFEHEQPGQALAVIPAKIGPAATVAAQQPVRPQRQIEAGLSDLIGELGRANVLGHPVGIFGVEIIKAALGLEFGHQQRPVTQHGGGQLAPADEWLGQQALELLPRALAGGADRVAIIALSRNDRDPDRRAFVDRLQDIGPLERVALENLLDRHDPPAGHRYPVRDQRLLGQLLVDRDHRGDHSGMGIGQPHQVHHALYRAIFAGGTVERVEHHVGRSFVQPLRHIMAHIDPGHPVAALLQRQSDALAAHQRDRPFVRPAAHQDRDVKARQSPLPLRGEGWERGSRHGGHFDFPSPRPSRLKGRGRDAPTL